MNASNLLLLLWWIDKIFIIVRVHSDAQWSSLGFRVDHESDGVERRVERPFPPVCWRLELGEDWDSATKKISGIKFI